VDDHYPGADDAITDADGSYTLHLQPAVEGVPGDTLTLQVTLADLQLERVGTIAWELYMPLIKVRETFPNTSTHR
jgi:hypothetical protein